MSRQAASVRRIDPAGVGLLALGVGLGWALQASTKALYAVQGQFATAVAWLPVGYAFAAGMVGAVNPCGILLLPSLVAYVLAHSGGASQQDRGRIGRVVLFAVAATAGFVLLFGSVGLVVGLGGRVLARWFPHGGVAVGAGMLALGAWLTLSGQDLGLPSATRVWDRLRPTGELSSYLAFGAAYGICSLACTLPVFLAAVGSALAAGSLVSAATRFVSYALGMGTVLTAALLAMAFFEAAATRWVRAVVPRVHRLAAAFLVAAGVFTVGYWWRAL